jgi:glucokinase
MKYRLGIDIGATKIAFGLFNEDRVIVYHHKSSTNANSNPKEFENAIVQDIDVILNNNGLQKDDIAGIAMGFPSYVDFDKGEVVFTSNMVNLHHFYARDVFQKHFPNTKIVVDNDTNLAAIAESKYGAGRGFKHMLYTALSTGVGSGFIINNAIFRGSYGGAGESGHMIITPKQGISCGCGNTGCFMSYTSGSMIVQHAKIAIQEGEKSVMADLVAGDLDTLTAEHLNTAYQMGDKLAEKLLDQMGYYLGIYVYNMFIGLNFNCYVFGGGLVNFGDAIMDRIRDSFNSFNHQKDQEVYFKTAELKNDFGIIGAAELLYE